MIATEATETTEPADTVRAAFELAWSDEARVLAYRFSRPGPLLMIMVLVALSGNQLWEGLREPGDYWLAYGPITVLALVLLGTLGGAHSQFKAIEPRHRQIEYLFSRDAIRGRNGVSEMTLSWDGVAAWTETASAVLLCLKPMAWRPIPKRGFTSETGLQTFRTILSEQIPLM